MRAQHVEAQNFTRPIFQKIGDREKIAEGLRHLLAFDLKEAIVHPHARERMTAMRPFALRDFVFMMRKDKIDSAAMNVEGLAQQSLAHRRAFDMPAGAP